MHHKVKLFIFLSVLVSISTADASSITYETRNIDTAIASDYKSSWLNQTSSITSQMPTDFNNLLGGNNTFSHLTLDLSSVVNQITFQFGLDAGYGGAVYLDNTLVTEKAFDLWWNYDWNNSSQVLSSSFNNLSSGNHVFDIYWAEGCCNGGNSARFSLDGGSTWQSASVDNINALPAAVPVPAALWLFGSGIVGLIGLRKDKKIVSQLTVA
jgi:hypothetical protein